MEVKVPSKVTESTSFPVNIVVSMHPQSGS
jgi:hypothetical protein